MPPSVHITTAMVWNITVILLVVDTALAFIASRAVNRAQFQVLRSLLTIAGGIFFFLVWVSVLAWGWDWFYVYIFPAWARFALPPLFCLVYAAVAWMMAWLSNKLPGNPAVTWCVLGGLEGLISHLYAIYGLGAASKPPIIQGTDPFAVLIFAVFEKAFYWSLILLACRFISRWVVPKPAVG